MACIASLAKVLQVSDMRNKVLADSMEALIAAAHEGGGIQAAFELIWHIGLMPGSATMALQPRCSNTCESELHRYVTCRGMLSENCLYSVRAAGGTIIL